MRESMKEFLTALLITHDIVNRQEVHVWRQRKFEDDNQRKFRKISTKNILQN